MKKKGSSGIDPRHLAGGHSECVSKNDPKGGAGKSEKKGYPGTKQRTK